MLARGKIVGKTVFLLLPKYRCSHGHDDRPHYRVSIDGRFIEVSFILTGYMYNEISRDGNTIGRYVLAILNIPPAVHELEPHWSETATQMLQTDTISKSL